MVLMKSFLATPTQREALEGNIYLKKGQYFRKEPTLSNDSTTIQYSYYWIGPESIISDGNTYRDPDYGGNNRLDLTKSVNTRKYFGNFNMSIEQKNTLKVFKKTYKQTGIFPMNLWYGNAGDITSEPIFIFDGMYLKCSHLRKV